MANLRPKVGPGRPKGALNKRTRARLAHETRMDESGEPLSVAKLTELDVLRYKMRWHMNRFAALQQREPPDHDKMEKHLDKAAEAARESAPYHFSRIAGLLVGAMNLTKIEVTGGLPDEQDGSWIDARTVAAECADSSTPNAPKAIAEGNR
jgi:hypothetical protein